MKTYKECQNHSQYKHIKQSTIETINRYFEHGIPAGGFITAVLSNDLIEAMSRSDEENRATLFEIVMYLYNECPCRAFGAWGSLEAVHQWIKFKGLKTDEQSMEEVLGHPADEI